MFELNSKATKQKQATSVTIEYNCITLCNVGMNERTNDEKEKQAKRVPR